MKQLILEPKGWPCSFSECPPGLFVCGGDVGLKTDYGDGDEAFCDNGDRFCSLDAQVQPVVAAWVQIDD